MQPITERTAGEVARAVKDTPVQSAGTVRRSLSITQLSTAMVAVQKSIEDPTKNKRADAGTRGSYRYADLPTVLDVVRPALTANGFSVMQFPCEMDDAPALTTLLIHTSGEWIETTAKIRPTDMKPQAVGSALTYARRYALLALCGIAADDDDDGKAASHPARPREQETTPSEWARRLVSRVNTASGREAAGVLWNEYEDAARAGKVSATDKAMINTAFANFSSRFPRRPAPTPAPTPTPQPVGVA